MLLDLAILTVIGCILEALATKMSGLVLRAAPAFTFSFLITFIAIMRWNWRGLFVIPFLAGATILGGHFNDLPYLAAIYDWRIYLGACVGLCTLSVNIIFFKKFGTKRVMLKIFAVAGLILLDYVLFNEFFKMMYRLLCTGNPFLRGEILFEAMLYDEAKDDLVAQTVNLCYYVEKISLFNVLGLVLSFVGIFVLRSQGVVNNVVDKLIEDKKAKTELMAAENFEIPEPEEKVEAKTGESDVDSNDSQEN